jgi:hypothetical protein
MRIFVKTLQLTNGEKKDFNYQEHNSNNINSFVSPKNVLHVLTALVNSENVSWTQLGNFHLDVPANYEYNSKTGY